MLLLLLLSSWSYCINFELIYYFRAGTYSRAAFIISARSYCINFTRLNVQACGYCGGAGSVRKGIAAAAHNAKCEILYLLDETFIISALS